MNYPSDFPPRASEPPRGAAERSGAARHGPSGTAARCTEPQLLELALPCRLLTSMQTLAQDENRFVAVVAGDVSFPAAGTLLWVPEKILMMAAGTSAAFSPPFFGDKSFMRLSFPICGGCCTICT